MKGNDMTKYTTTSLIKELEKFPEDLPIETELAMVYNYNDDKVIEETSGKTFKDMDEVYDIYSKHATELAIFEGSWEEDNISDLNNIMPKYVLGWEVDDHCGPNAILKKDILSVFFRCYAYEDVVNGCTREVLAELGLTGLVDEIDSKVKAQAKYCEENNLPLFAYEDGVCLCGNQIYNKISLEEAGSELITSCPYCSRAFND